MTQMVADDWGAEYRAARGTYETFSLRLQSLIVDLLKDAGIDFIQVEARAKDVDSFVEKIGRKGAKYQNPIQEMTDLVGLRIITYYLEDVVRVGEILRAQFVIDEANSVDKAAGFDPDRFGYTSVHYVLKLSPARGKLAEWRPFKGVCAEVQVRTALQHAWAAVNHKLDYKSTTEAPARLRRRLFRLSALFELADEQFSELRDERERISSEYEGEVREGYLDIPLNDASLLAYINDSETMRKFVARLRELGLLIADFDEKRLARDRSDLLNVLDLYDIETVAELDNYIKSVLLPDMEISPFSEYSTSVPDWVTAYLLMDKRASKETVIRIYTEAVWDKLSRAAKIWQQRTRQNASQKAGSPSRVPSTRPAGERAADRPATSTGP
ncbi:GTP pyrophosphokinase family protein [Micromonospora chersina]|uniref:GTP pyrophosphokinase n=1 Tax=Micromonospora chersina TaxID=47854 RepID=UPI003716B1D4